MHLCSEKIGVGGEGRRGWAGFIHAILLNLRNIRFGTSSLQQNCDIYNCNGTLWKLIIYFQKFYVTKLFILMQFIKCVIDIKLQLNSKIHFVSLAYGERLPFISRKPSAIWESSPPQKKNHYMTSFGGDREQIATHTDWYSIALEDW